MKRQQTGAQQNDKRKSKASLIQEDLYQDAKTNATGALVYT